ncbi:MAG: Gfo/Idh/MocA family oxidoreductase [Fimbriimonadaceae bacterium]|nr:Gfo/Idh/MocA family oxidoreductase [Fimbriimonadaceae bacterium]
MTPEPSRRDLLRLAASAGAAAALGPVAWAAPAESGSYPARDRKGPLRVAAVGVGGRGRGNINSVGNLGEIVALIDVDAETRAKAGVDFPNAATFADFRQALMVMRDEIDAVIVSTPDHTHAVAAALAMRLGKAVYCEKPLTRTIWEARELAKLQRKHRVITQMGNQYTSADSLRNVAALIRAGEFGAVREVHCWTNRAGGWWPQGVARPETKPTPKKVNFDLWLGPSADRPYADGYHPFAWRGWWDFGAGALGDIGCHCMNLPFMALDLRDPVAVQAKTSGHNRDSFPLWSIVDYEFAKTARHDAFKLTWYDGGKLPDERLAPGVKYGGNGSLIVCEKATIYAANEYGANAVRLDGQALPTANFTKSPGHMAEFLNAIRTGQPASSDFSNYAVPLTETVLLGNLAVWADGPRVEWDARRMQVKGSSEYDALIRPTLRKGWTL